MNAAEKCTWPGGFVSMSPSLALDLLVRQQGYGRAAVNAFIRGWGY
jgi:hypothetical protein